MRIKGAVWNGERLVVTDQLTVRPVGQGEVRVRILRSGICHSDLNMMESPYCPTPIVLGHEGAGEVVEIGAGVSGWRVGDRVMIGTQTPCGECRECARDTPHNCDSAWGFAPDARFDWAGTPVWSFANISSFASETVVRASQLYRIGDLPFEQAALIGCAVSTGVAAAERLGKTGAGDRVVVFGVGGIGVNAIAGAARAGAEVIAVDVNPAKEAVARHFGARHFHRADPALDAVAAARALAAAYAPVDIAIECSGATSAVETAIRTVKRGGRTVLIGMSAGGSEARLPLDRLLLGGEIVSTMNGGARPEQDYPAYIDAARTGTLDVAAQISATWPLDEIDDAIAALKAGQVTRAVLAMDG